MIVPIHLKPNINNYINNIIPYKKCYSEFKIMDCYLENFKINSDIRDYMESITKKYKLIDNNLKLLIINNPEWYDSLDVEINIINV